MSSDKLANIREPLSEIHFELKTEEGIKNVSLELDKEELKMLIDKMEAANKVRVDDIVLHHQESGVPAT